VTAIHQFVPTFEPGAVGSHILAAQQVLRGAGFESEIFAGEVDPSLHDRGAHDFRAYGRAVHAQTTDRLVYHVAIGSAVADFVRNRPETLVVDHHNLTPLRFLDGWEPIAAGGVVWGRRQLAGMAERCALGLADSRFNEAELVELSFPRTAVVPILIPPAALDGPFDEESRARLAAGRTGATWLFVGRLAPNKAQHDLVKAFAAYRRFHDADARLHLVGGASSVRYERALRRFVENLALGDAVEIAGAVSEAAKRAYYEAADVFVVVSDHEGFCVPLIEAMYHQLPIVAFAAGAVGETIGDAGIVLDTKDPCTIAAAVARVIGDPRLRAQLVTAGEARRADFDIAHTGAALLAALEKVESA
jgi:glycosyltransferase involved in cell wall biosynthesis